MKFEAGNCITYSFSTIIAESSGNYATEQWHDCHNDFPPLAFSPALLKSYESKLSEYRRYSSGDNVSEGGFGPELSVPAVCEHEEQADDGLGDGDENCELAVSGSISLIRNICIVSLSTYFSVGWSFRGS